MPQFDRDASVDGFVVRLPVPLAWMDVGALLDSSLRDGFAVDDLLATII